MPDLGMRYTMTLLFACLFTSCMQETSNKNESSINGTGEVAAVSDRTDINSQTDTATSTAAVYSYTSGKIDPGNTTPEQLLAYASTLQGIPYKYGSINPAEGFDCSGFITHVFNHFNIAVPRSSVDFTNVESEVPLQQAKPGDLVLFTGTDSTTRIVGHMGIITDVAGSEMSFIHSTSGKADVVTITPLNRYYMGRFMKVVRVFK